MDHTGVTPAVALSAPDLAHIVQRPGPFLTVYLTTEVSVENAAQRAEVRWKTVRTGLAGQGVDERILALVDPLVADAHLQGECLVAIATPRGLAHVAHEPDPPRRDVARWGPLPILGPLLEWRQSQVPHIVALVDRKGGDLFVFPTTHPDEHVEIEGGDDPIHRSKPGGWSQKRYQRRAEHTWEANAEEVAAALTELVDEEQPRLVAVGGDARSAVPRPGRNPARARRSRRRAHGLVRSRCHPRGRPPRRPQRPRRRPSRAGPPDRGGHPGRPGDRRRRAPGPGRRGPRRRPGRRPSLARLTRGFLRQGPQRKGPPGEEKGALSYGPGASLFEGGTDKEISSVLGNRLPAHVGPSARPDSGNRETCPWGPESCLDRSFPPTSVAGQG